MSEINTTNIDTTNNEDIDVYLTDNEGKYLLDKLGVYLTTTNKKENNVMATKKYVSLEKLGLYDEKIKGVISAGDTASLDAAKAYADSLADNYDVAGAATTAESNAKSYTDAEVAKANSAAAAAQAQADKGVTDAATADSKAVAAQTAVDELAEYVGTIPESATATDVVGYVIEKTSGIATEGAMTELDNRVGAVEGDVATIKGDYLKKADKDELAGDIADVQSAVDAEAARADAAEKANAASIKAIQDDYLTSTDKESLEANIKSNADAITLLTDGVDAEKVDGVKDLIAYVEEHGTEVTGIKEDIAQNASDIAGVAGRMTTAEDKITAVEGAVATKAEKTYVDEANNALSGRIATLEGKFTEGEGSVEDMISDAVDAAISAEETRVDGLLEGKVDKVDGKGLSTNDLTNDLKANYDAAYAHSQETHAPANAQANIIESVKVNGTALTITDKAVDIAVPTDNIELTNGAGYLVANDIANKADKATTLAGYGIADAYTTAQVDSAIADAVGQFVECSEAEINAMFA